MRNQLQLSIQRTLPKQMFLSKKTGDQLLKNSSSLTIRSWKHVKYHGIFKLINGPALKLVQNFCNTAIGLKLFVTGDETSVHYFESESTRRSPWNGTIQTKINKHKSQPSVGKIVATVFWDIAGV